MTIAEVGSFAAAARELGLAQPAVSKQMAKLEQELDRRLFVRGIDGVRLTAAGEAFLRGAREMIALHDRAVERARSAAPIARREIQLGYAELLRSHESLVASIVATFADREPETEVVTHRLASAEQWRALDARQLHAGVGYGEPSSSPRLVRAPLADASARGVLISAEHPLAGASAVHFRDLGALPLLLFAREVNPPLHDHVLAALAARGLTPTLRTGLHAHTAREAAVRAGQGWMLAVDGLPEASEGVVAREVADAPIVTTLSLWWRADETEPAVLSFVEVARAAREPPDA